MRLPPLSTPGEVVRLYRLSAIKRLSQNFILDMGINKKFVKAAGALHGCHVCEVGPGPGGITRAILQKDIEHLHTIEIDKRFFPGLETLAEASGQKLTNLHGDVLQFHLDNLFPEEIVEPWDGPPPKCHIMGNLPFNVSTPLIIRYLESVSERRDAWRYGRTKMTFTFQKEVGERMVARVDSEPRCRLSVVCQYLCHVNLKYIIPGKGFVPPPDVDVAVVHLVPRKVPCIDLPFKLVNKVIRHLFHYKNKYCKKGLATLFPHDKQELVDDLLGAADINPTKRSRSFSIEDIGRLCHAYRNICDQYPYIYKYEYRDPDRKALYDKLMAGVLDDDTQTLLEDFKTHIPWKDRDGGKLEFVTS